MNTYLRSELKDETMTLPRFVLNAKLLARNITGVGYVKGYVHAMVMRLTRRKKSSPLKVELNNLILSVERTERILERMNEDFWADGGVCCPTCGCPGYRELEWKQERREKRIAYLKNKLGS